MQLEQIAKERDRRVAVIYQQVAPPVFDGARKDPKPGGYSDSGADIAYCLRQRGIDVITPVAEPVVAVTRNSAALTPAEASVPQVAALMDACAKAFEAVGALAPIRIDCRADASGNYKLFDLNAKPNMTGAGRPGRDEQDSLSAIAARASGWSYGDLLEAMLDGAWKLTRD